MYLITSNVSSTVATAKQWHNGDRCATAVFGDQQRRRCSAINVSCYGQCAVNRSVCISLLQFIYNILRLEPQFEGQQPAHSQHSEAGGATGSSAEDTELKMPDITEAFGTQKDKDKEAYLISATCHQRRQRPNNGTTGAGVQRLCSAISGSGAVRRPATTVVGNQLAKNLIGC
ncbi:hypothetical protein GUJ93_ZPchr0002g24925 [Zizania palustris]|uniref:Uncharacterized protein n=1 Tax=Zizania palustris TaxID=103762 RepID=A0A8J5VTI3_ZIZPA|nr:hypothetical protein GUJ93_ZPchr0002g24925 [Zizania palustris]